MSTTPPTVSTVAETEKDADTSVQELKMKLEVVRSSMAAMREVVKTTQQKADQGEFDFTDGISLLSLKCNVMLQYLQNLVLLCAHRVKGNPLTERTRPTEPFSDPERGPRGSAAGDRIDALLEEKVILQKIRAMEGKMKYQIEKLIKAAQEPVEGRDVTNDPLAFRPNPAALLDQESGSDDEGAQEEEAKDTADGIYRPPKIAPMPYTETRKDKKDRRGPLPSALTSLAQMDLSMPHIESTSGLGSTPALMSKRAKELQRMNEFEEENMTRLIMKKKDAKRRIQDEADIALGGTGGGGLGRRGRGGGLEDEFGDILRSVGRSRSGVIGDGYEELRQKGKKANILARSRDRSADDADESMEDGPRQRKRSRFDLAVKSAKRRSSVKGRK
ncbi:hypothetical protein ABKN59_003054 [Abortiporus biennis]